FQRRSRTKYIIMHTHDTFPLCSGMKREADAGYVQAFYVQYPIVVPCCSTLNRVAIEASVHAFANICHFIIWQSGRWGQGCTFLTERFFLADATSNWSIHLNK